MPRKVFWYPSEATEIEVDSAMTFIAVNRYTRVEQKWGWSYWENDPDIAAPDAKGLDKLREIDIFHVCGHGASGYQLLKSNHGDGRELSTGGIVERMVECNYPKNKNIKIVLYSCFSAGGADSFGKAFATSLKEKGGEANEYTSAGNIWGFSMRTAMKKYGLQDLSDSWRTNTEGKRVPNMVEMSDEPEYWQMFPCKAE